MTITKSGVNRRSFLKAGTAAGAVALASPALVSKALAASGELDILMWSDYLPDGFLAEFKAEMDLRIQEIRSSTPMEGAEPIRLPGEMALERQRQMRSDGVPVARPVLLQLREIAHRLGLPDRLDDGR